MTEITSDPDAYRALFKVEGRADAEVLRDALTAALDIRKFEIDVYWKRAAYFWTLIAASLVAFFALKGTAGGLSTLLIGGLGALFALGWYLVNRGSSSWQRNWEVHVDLLEDAVIGPLYKTHMDRKTQRFWALAGPYPYSPSRINTLLSLIAVATWTLLDGALACNLLNDPASRWPAAALLALTAGGALSLLIWGRSRSANPERTFEVRTRSYRPAAP